MLHVEVQVTLRPIAVGFADSANKLERWDFSGTIASERELPDFFVTTADWMEGLWRQQEPTP